MDVISPIGAPATTPPKTEAPKISTDYQMFLKMLTAQMKNQDPLNPIESSDYATQLATFSGVEQQVKTNQLLESLTGQLGVSGMGQLAAWVGMEARAAVPAFFSGASITVFPAPAKDADKAFLIAYDAQDQEVSRQVIAVSTDPLQWTGTTATGGQMLPGNYSFRLESYQAGKLTANDTVEVFSRLTEVRQSDKGAVLATESGATVLPSEVKTLRPTRAP